MRCIGYRARLAHLLFLLGRELGLAGHRGVLIGHGIGSYAGPQQGGAMRFWFSKITSREDASDRIKLYSYLFFLLAAVQIIVGIMIISSPAEVRRFVSLSPDAALNYLATAAIVVVLSFILWVLRSRVAAVILLLLCILITGLTAVNTAAKAPSGNLFIALMAVVLAVRSVQATFKFHGHVASSDPSAEPPANHKPAESPPPAPKPYDIEKWEALVKYDDEISIVAEKLRPLGEKWIDEFARSYLILNDKKYLLSIVQKIIKAAREEAERTHA